MKVLWKILLFGLLAAALALGVRYVYVQGSALMERDGGTWDSDALVEAKNLFMNRLDEVQYLTAALEHLAFALAAGALTATSRRQVHACFAELAEERTTGCYVIFLVAVDGDFDVAGGNEVLFGN